MNMNTNQMNMLHMMNHHNTTETMSNVMLTGWDAMIMAVETILLIWGGVKVMEWMLEKTYEMKEPWGTIVFIIGMFGYVLIGGLVICLPVCI